MAGIQFLSIAQQVAQHLRQEIARGRWAGQIPGKPALAKDLGLNEKTVEAALRQLEKDGLICSQGVGRARKIVGGMTGGARRLRTALLLWDQTDWEDEYVRLMGGWLESAGHEMVVADKTLHDLKMSVPRIAHLVEQTQADAWVISGGSHEVLQWFSKQKFPALAVFGQSLNLPLAAVAADKSEALADTVGHLAELGHRRVVLLLRRQHRLPLPGPSAQGFMKAMAAHGLAGSDFALPDWEDSAEGFHACLESLFKLTPPTALIADEALLFSATLQFLAARGLRVPQNVSLVFQGHEAIYDWCKPTIARIETDLSKIKQHLTRWAKNLAKAKVDLEKHMLPSRYLHGDTVGPVAAGGGVGVRR